MSTTSRFYEPCLKVLQENAPNPMGVTDIWKAANIIAPELKLCCKQNGAIRQMLLNEADSNGSPIRQVEGSKPPLFYVEKPVTTATESNSIFYKPACEILKANAPNTMSVSEIKDIIIEQYPDLEWSHLAGPVRSMLMRAASITACPIRQKPESCPPVFYWDPGKAKNTGSVTVEPSSDEIMEEAYQKAESKQKKELLAILQKMKPELFEHLANQLVAKMLFGTPENTRYAGDGGVDGYVHTDPLKLNTVRIQAKRYSNPVRIEEVREFGGVLNTENMNGVFVTCSTFPKSATEFAEKLKSNKLVLIDGEQLVKYMIQYRVGVKETGKAYILTKIDQDFFDELQ